MLKERPQYQNEVASDERKNLANHLDVVCFVMAVEMERFVNENRTLKEEVKEIANLRVDRMNYEMQIKDLMERMAKLTKENSDLKKENNNFNQQGQKQLTDAQNEIAKLKQIIANQQTQIQQLLPLQSKVDQLTSQNQSLTDEIARLKKQIADLQQQLEELVSLRSKYADKCRQFDESKLINEGLLKIKKDLEDEIERLKKQIQQLNDRVKQLTSENNDFKNQISGLQSQNQALSANLQALQKDSDNAKQLEEILEEKDEQIQDLEDQLDTLKNELDSLNKELADKDNLIAQLKQRIKELEDLLKQSQAALKESEKKLKKFEKDEAKAAKQNQERPAVQGPDIFINYLLIVAENDRLNILYGQMIAALEQANNLNDQLTKEQAKLRALTKELENKLSDSNQKLASLERENLNNGSKQDELDRLKRQILEYEEKIALLTMELQRIKGTSSVKQSFIPFNNPQDDNDLISRLKQQIEDQLCLIVMMASEIEQLRDSQPKKTSNLTQSLITKSDNVQVGYGRSTYY